MRSLASVFTAALIATALAAPQALAMPDKGPVKRADSDATYRGGFYMPHVGGQDRSDAARQTLGPLPGSADWPFNTPPAASVQARPAPDDGGPPWEAIALCVAAAAAAVACAGALVHTRRRAHRARMAA
jgi:hypothetical protein